MLGSLPNNERASLIERRSRRQITLHSAEWRRGQEVRKARQAQVRGKGESKRRMIDPWNCHADLGSDGGCFLAGQGQHWLAVLRFFPRYRADSAFVKVLENQPVAGGGHSQ
jgi:hypothetical protein